MRPKIRKPPISVGGSKNYAQIDCPRYMNVPSPAPCRVVAASVGKQSVWGLRIIACISISTVTSFLKFVNTQKWLVLRQSEAAETICQLNGWLHFMRARKWDGTRGQNSLVVPNIVLRKDATAR